MPYRGMLDMLDGGDNRLVKGFGTTARDNKPKITTKTKKNTGFGGAPDYGATVKTTPGFTKWEDRQPKTPTPTTANIGGGGGYGGGYSGGGLTSSRPDPGNIGAGLTAPKAPDRVTYENLSPDLQALYDEFGYYKPDWNQLDQSQQGILDIFGRQREDISAEHDIAKDDLQRSFDRAMGMYERGQQYRREDFADARQQLTEDAYMQQRGVEAGAASRGLGESGIKEAAMIQGRMAMGQGMNEYARQYYEMEREATEAINFAREDYEATQVKLQQTLQSALTDIAGSEAMSIQQYTDKIEQMKRQMEADKNAVAQAKQNFLEVEFNSRMALAGFQQAQYETELQAEFSKADLEQRQFESDRQYQLAQQQMAQQAAQHAAGLELQREQMARAGEGADPQARAEAQAILKGMMDGEITRNRGGIILNSLSDEVRAIVEPQMNDAYAIFDKETQTRTDLEGKTNINKKGQPQDLRKFVKPTLSGWDPNIT